MRVPDFFVFSSRSLKAHGLRTFLTVTGIAVGIAAVIMLTSIGEGLHRFVISEFTQFGTNIIGVSPGKAETRGGPPVGIFGSDRPLTLADAKALQKIPYVEAINPGFSGNAEIKANGKSRRVLVNGAGPQFPEAFHMDVASGRFLPPDEYEHARAFVVLGSKAKEELYGNTNPLGTRIRVGGDRYTVMGVMASKGQVLGFDMDDTAFIPASRALALFNRDSLMEIDVIYDPDVPVDRVVEEIRKVLVARHGREDFTITPQEKMLDVLGSVLDVLTFAVGAIGGISLVVGGVGILTIMTISVTERTGEIGLLRAVGAKRSQILSLFLAEAVLLSMLGGILGLASGFLMLKGLRFAFPSLPVHTPWSYAILAECFATAIGLIAGVVPARSASRLDPVEALRTE
ncbi:MAG TPA: ABC transporter permease [Burkholderiales bacterium]|nr:ABC transporter permease [Burkholderiales bacterium]